MKGKQSFSRRFAGAGRTSSLLIVTSNDERSYSSAYSSSRFEDDMRGGRSGLPFRVKVLEDAKFAEESDAL